MYGFHRGTREASSRRHAEDVALRHRRGSLVGVLSPRRWCGAAPTGTCREETSDHCHVGRVPGGACSQGSRARPRGRRDSRRDGGGRRTDESGMSLRRKDDISSLLRGMERDDAVFSLFPGLTAEATSRTGSKGDDAVFVPAAASRRRAVARGGALHGPRERADALSRRATPRPHPRPPACDGSLGEMSSSPIPPERTPSRNAHTMNSRKKP